MTINFSFSQAPDVYEITQCMYIMKCITRLSQGKPRDAAENVDTYRIIQ